YQQANTQVKLAAGWLIDQAGWKGKQLGAVGMFHKQALVLVNYGQASLTDVRKTYRAVQQSVWEKFKLLLEPEPVLFDQNGLIRSHQDQKWYEYNPLRGTFATSGHWTVCAIRLSTGV